MSSAILGVDATRSVFAVRSGIAGRIVLTWVVTIPACIVLAWIVYSVLRIIAGVP